jgi:hypothetical protein
MHDVGGYLVLLVINCHIPWGNTLGREANNLVSRLMKLRTLFALHQRAFMCPYAQISLTHELIR